jgi:hypothetical protein
MPLSLQDTFNLPDSKRRTVKLVYKPRGRYRKEIRPKFTQDELVSFVRERNVRAIRQIEKVRKQGDPTVSDFRRAFKKWRDVLCIAYGWNEPLDVVRDPEYLAKVVIQLGITTVEGYIEAHRKRPDIVPSYRHLIQKWGGFRRLKEITRRYSLALLLNDYLVLKRRLGRHPTLEECKFANVNLEKGLEFFGKKERIDEFLDSMEKKK